MKSEYLHYQRHASKEQYRSEDYPMPYHQESKPKGSNLVSASKQKGCQSAIVTQAQTGVKLEKADQRYWGNLKPYSFDAITNTPKIIITPHFLRSLLLNLLIIGVLCLALPILTNKNMMGQALTPSGHNRRLSEELLTELNKEDVQDINVQLVRQNRILATVSPRYVARKYSIYIFSAIWSTYELTFLLILLLGNPGYSDPIAERQISIQERNEIQRYSQQRNLQGLNKCQICKTIVDNSVYHCPICDLCCEGFSHHCEWVGKCIGYRNEIFLKSYYYGFFVGIILLVLLIILQSLPYQ